MSAKVQLINFHLALNSICMRPPSFVWYITGLVLYNDGRKLLIGVYPEASHISEALELVVAQHRHLCCIRPDSAPYPLRW